ncbi:hypothetical protein QNH09_gp21 [Aeromonas phage PVN03]|uniref:Uncharacterized protein n=1 Tax=Aeromonas phage PVN03 TaxID=2822864 RepID=A0AAE7RB01_9CAUD|nr:hypothetical protein QNH09_gp21 [Aeromonas phage PVN03]QTQ06803.1 hypothetical protein [Aeromonas phage PVN03]
MMLITVGVILVFMWIACVLMPRKTAWGAGGPADIEPWTTPSHWKPAEKPVQVYVLLCISTENTLRAVLPSTKALLAEIPVDGYQWAEARADFASQIVDGLSNACGLNVEPIIYSTPLAHNVIPVIEGQHAVLLMHNLVKRRLESCRQPF